MLTKVAKLPKTDHSNDPLFQSAGSPKLTKPITDSQFPTATESTYKTIQDVFSLDNIVNDDDFSEAPLSRPPSLLKKRAQSPDKKGGSPTKSVKEEKRKFGDLIIAPDPPTDLYCEECEKQFSSFFCSECDQVFCRACADLCHPREYGGKLPHYHEVNQYIRPVAFGDKSRVKKDTTWWMPNEEFHPEDMQKIKNISIPDSLATNSHRSAEKSLVPYQTLPKYRVNQIVLFIDAVSRQESFGRIISQWDFRNGHPNVPALVRGDRSNTWYTVERLGRIDEVPSLQYLLESTNKEKTDLVLPNLGIKTIRSQSDAATEGTGENGAIPLCTAPNLVELRLARELDRKIAEMRSIKTLGPKYHLRSPNLFENAKELEQSGRLPPTTTTHSSLQIEQHSHTEQLIAQIAENKGNNFSWSKVSHHHSSSTADEMYRDVDLNAYNGIDIDIDAHASALAGTGSNLGPAAASNIPMPAAQRQYEHLFNGTSSTGGGSGGGNVRLPPISVKGNQHEKQHALVMHRAPAGNYNRDKKTFQRSMNVLVLAERDMTLLEDQLRAVTDRKMYLLNKLIFEKDVTTNQGRMRKRFRQWWSSMDHLRHVQTHYCARTIQTQARVWLCRNKLSEVTQHWHNELERRRQLVHGQFRYSTKDDPYSATMDGRMFFKTIADVNRYAYYLRKMLTKMLRLLTRKRHKLIRRAIDIWRGNIGSFLESSITVTHFMEDVVDVDTPDVGFLAEKHGIEPYGSVTEQKKRIIERFSAVKDLLTEKVDELPPSPDLKPGHGSQHRGLFNGAEPEQGSMSSNDEYGGEEYEDHLSFGMSNLAAPGTGTGGQRVNMNGLGRPAEGEYDELGYDSIVCLPLRMHLHTHALRAACAPRRGDGTILHIGDDVRVPPLPPPDADAPPASPLKIPTGGVPQESDALIRLEEDKKDADQLYSTTEEVEEDTVNQTLNSKVPGYSPSEYLKDYLPPLPQIFDPKTADGRLNITVSKRLEYASFRSAVQGPTDASSWAIARSLLIGPLPLNEAEQVKPGMKKAKQVMSAISAILLEGVDLFISLLPEEEERSLQEQVSESTSQPVKEVRSQIESAYALAKRTVNEITVYNSTLINKQTAALQKIPFYGKSDPRFQAAYNQKLRCKARIRLAAEAISKAKQQVSNLAKHVDWKRMVVTKEYTPGINTLLPQLWELEQYIASGRRIYMYSGDGHGRVGMMAGMLIGRLYGLHHYETTYRIQAIHDCARREQARQFPITCPQNPEQRQRIVEVLSITNRVLGEPTLRSQVDPETFVTYENRREVISEQNAGAFSAWLIKAHSQHQREGYSAIPQERYTPKQSRRRKDPEELKIAEEEKKRREFLEEREERIATAPPEEGGNDDDVVISTAISTADQAEGDAPDGLDDYNHFVEGNTRAKKSVLFEHKISRNKDYGKTIEAQPLDRKILTNAATDLVKLRAVNATARLRENSDVVAYEGGMRAQIKRDPPVVDLYNPAVFGQNMNVVRRLPIGRQVPAKEPKLPIIRTGLY